jgi:hypothetical protein
MLIPQKYFLKTAAFICFLLMVTGITEELLAQPGNETVHRRGRLWENLHNDGWIGSLGAWDFLTSQPIGLYPGFEGFFHPVGGMHSATNTYANANMHNFRSGVWIVAKDLQIPGTPPAYTPVQAEYEIYFAGLQDHTYGVAQNREPIELYQNFIEEPGYDPSLPEEYTIATWHTNTGVTVTRRSSVWSFPGYSDFILYDYEFENTGMIVSTMSGEVVNGFPPQTLRDVYFVFHSGISVSTRGQINFHSDFWATQAGAFGWQPSTYRNYYHIHDNETLVFSTHYNGGREPTPWDTYPLKNPASWQQRFGNELHDPAAFGWLALYADPRGATPRQSPRPDVLRIDSHKGGTFQGRDLDLEFFRLSSGVAKKTFHDLAQSPDLQPGLGNDGNRLNFFTFSYGPYTLAPGERVRFVIAEIAGVMDYHDVIAGDPEGNFPDSTIAAIVQNAQNARNAVAWGFGATHNGFPVAGHVPPPPPSPVSDAVNASVGTEIAAIAVTWDNVAEVTSITDGAGSLFYDGINDLDGYRVYRSTDFQFTTNEEPPVLRGAAWDLLIDIPKAEFQNYWDPELDRYRVTDEDVDFGRRYGYYVSAYRSQPRAWTSINGTVVDNLPELASGDLTRTAPTSAAPGPVMDMDIYVAPNPFVMYDEVRSFGSSDPYKIEFRNLPERATIRIYTTMGEVVRVIEHGPDHRGNVFGSYAWDQRSDSGLLVSPGLYVYHVQSKTEGLNANFTGKLMIIR